MRAIDEGLFGCWSKTCEPGETQSPVDTAKASGYLDLAYCTFLYKICFLAITTSVFKSCNYGGVISAVLIVALVVLAVSNGRKSTGSYQSI